MGEEREPSTREQEPDEPMGPMGSTHQADRGVGEPLREEDVTEEDRLSDDVREGDEGELPGG